jgi:hypothetical protein
MSKLDEKIIEVGLKIAKRGEGALIVVGKCEYTPLVKQEVKPFNIIENPKLLESLALMDGAVILDKFGILVAYGVKIKSNRIFPNFGTRHSAGMSASVNEGTTAYVISEEDKKIRVFKGGRQVMQIDALEKQIERKIPEITNLLGSIGFGTLGSIGASVLFPTLGIAFLPGVIVFGSGYWIISKIKEMNNDK